MNDKYLNRVDARTRSRYLALSDERRLEVDRLFIHHARASAKCGLKPDPLFLCELMSEIQAGRVVENNLV